MSSLADSVEKNLKPAHDVRARGRVALMQPYFLPYLGYFQLIAAADCFVIYDNVQFIKNGWIERNRYLLDGEPKWFGVSLAKGSHTQLIMEKRISAQFEIEPLLDKLAFAYRKAPYVQRLLYWLEALLKVPAQNIAELNERVLRSCCSLLNLQTPILRASALVEQSNLSGQARVIELISHLRGSHYLNPAAGGELYQAPDFEQAGVTLELLSPTLTPYPQGGKPFVPALSILDALMFHEPEVAADWVKKGVVSRG